MNNKAEGLTFDSARSRPINLAVNCHIEFHENLPKNLTLVAFGISGDVLEIDAKRDFEVRSKVSQ